MASQPGDNPLRRGHASVWGVFLIFIGTVFLLQSCGVLPWELWLNLAAYWPVILIAAGLAILLRRRNAWLVSGILLALMLGSLGFAVWQYNATVSNMTTHNYSAPVEGLAKVQTNINFNAGELTVGALSSNSTSLVEMNGASSSGGIRADINRQGNFGVLSVERTNFSSNSWQKSAYTLNFHPDISNSLFVQSAAASNAINLSSLNIADARFKLDVTETTLTLPANPSGVVTVTFDVNLCDLSITVPQGVAVRIEVHSTAVDLQVNNARLIQSGTTYKTADFDTATSRIDIILNCNLSSVEIN
uniref:LiaI-LiaF-like transmembrane region domain-containing protein n=1 Tax=uncultured Dehalococcoidia bacterium TaxID=498747 RepID=A0A871YCA7_9CHLR|nr:hypothetical protein HULAa30F3_00017 [uncultured Dehalococcoidia bacterium]